MITKFLTPNQSDYFADHIRSKFGYSDDPYIDIVELATKIDCQVQEVEFEDEDHKDVSGMIEYKDNKFIISVNKFDTEARKRFTIAHELAHRILHFEEIKKDAFVDYRRSIAWYDDEAKIKKEIQANMLAASILMPKNIFIKYCKELGADVENLANIFKVSRKAAVTRLESLGLLD